MSDTDLERARRIAVKLENENARLEARAKEAKEQARVATVHAYRLRLQTPDAAQRTLDRVRAARTWCDVWVQLGQYYGLKPEDCGLQARDRRTTAERTAEARAERAEQRLAAVRALHRKASHGLVCVYCAPLQRIGYDATWPCDTIRALDGAQRPVAMAELRGHLAEAIATWADHTSADIYRAVDAVLGVVYGAQQPGTAGERELRPCGEPRCLPNRAHRYMLMRNGRVYQCPGAASPQQPREDGSVSASEPRSASSDPEPAEAANVAHAPVYGFQATQADTGHCGEECADGHTRAGRCVAPREAATTDACPNPAAHVEVSDPCPLCEGAPLFARRELARHLRERHAGRRNEAARLRETLTEVLAEFRFDTHPGEPCKQTGHVPVATVDRWRAALNGEEPTP